MSYDPKINPGVLPAAADKKKKKKAVTQTPIPTPARTPAVMSPAQQAYSNQNYTEFSDPTGTTTLTSVGGNIGARNQVYENAGLYEKGMESGAHSNNMYRLGSANAKSFDEIQGPDKIIHQISSAALNYAKSKGIKNGVEFRNRQEEILKAVGGKDYELMKSQNMIPNLGKTLANVYEDRIKNYQPAENRYNYDPVANRLVPKGTVVPNQQTPAAPTAAPAPRIRVNTPTIQMGNKKPD